MRPTTTKTTPWILAILSLVLASQAFAARARYVEERAYVGGFGLVTTLSSDEETGFNGIGGVYNGSTDTLSIYPRIKTNFGFGGLVGYRRGDYALEVSYWRSEHKAEYGDPDFWPVPYKDWAVYHAFNLDLKRFLLTHLPAQPYFSLGMQFPWLVVHNGSAYVNSAGYPVIKDVSYSGMGFNLGAGLEFFALPNVTITGGIVKRWSNFSSYKGADASTGQIVNQFGETVGPRDDSFSFFAGATVDFI